MEQGKKTRLEMKYLWKEKKKKKTRLYSYGLVNNVDSK